MERRIDCNKPYTCPVCGKYVFKRLGDFDVYPECGWQNDDWQEAGGVNFVSLEEFKAEYNGSTLV